ncbi:MAG: GyrI-like domain-containing protein [Desulfobacterales bacterium]|nr:GyrI-like domain-containing protein [Desulfobacterales bacterium]
MTSSHNQNFSIIRRHWKKFNTLLKVNKVKFGPNWEKYAITKKYDGHYHYLCAFPTKSHIRPFEFTLIPAGNYVKFNHKGPMNTIWETINKIYKDVIPNSDFNIDINRSMIHFEHYDAKFNWNRQDSIVGIYVPLTN